MAKKSLTEAAKEILQKSVHDAGSEQFGVGKKGAATPGQSVNDVGTGGHKTSDAGLGVAGVPSATPPGQKPPVGAEPMKKVSGQPNQTMGRSDLVGGQESQPEDSDKEKADRKKSSTAKTMQPNKGATSCCVPEAEESEEFEEDQDQLEEASLEEVQKDLQNLSDEEFKEKYGAPKKVVIAKIKEMQAAQQTHHTESEEEEEVEVEGEEIEEAATQLKPQKVNLKSLGTFASLLDKVHGDGKNKKSEADTERKSMATAMACREDVEAMLAGENLSEEFKEKATLIFESAVNARVEVIREEMETELLKVFEESVETIKEDYSSKIDSYLDYVVENWLEENKLAIEYGLRTEIAEDFMSALKTVFEEHYIQVPEEKTDLVEELVEKVTKLETSLNEEIVRNVELKKSLSEHKKEEVLHSVTEGLTLSQVEKIKSLAAGVEYISEEDFEGKLITIRENYFPSLIKPASTESLNDPVEINEEKETKVVDPFVDLLARKISKGSKF